MSYFSTLDRVKLRSSLMAVFSLIVMTGLAVTLTPSADAQIAPRAFSLEQTIEFDENMGGSTGPRIVIDGDVALVGDSVSAQAHVLVRENGVWTKKQTLIPNDSSEGTWFGWSVALKGDVAVIGAPGIPGRRKTGAVYIFRYQNGIWTQQQKLSVTGGQEHNSFGWWVGFDHDMLLATELSGTDSLSSVRVYMEQNGVWKPWQRLVWNTGGPDTLFGTAFTVENGTALIYSSNSSDGNPSHSTLYVYVRDGNVWEMQQRLILPFKPAIVFPVHMSLSGDLATFSDVGDTNMQGAIHRFTRENGVWSARPPLYAPVRDDYYGFGSMVDLDGNTLAVYAMKSVDSQGSVFIYRREGNQWLLQGEITAHDPATADSFGINVTLHGHTLMIAANGTQPPHASKIYVYTDPDLVTPTPETPTPETPTPETPTPDTPTPDTPTPDTPTPDTPTPETPTPETPTPEAAVELLVNSGFEADLNGWKLKNVTKDKVKCDKPEKPIASDGACVFQFKGGAGERSKLQQAVDVAATPVSTGDTLTLSGKIWTKGKVSGKVMLKVKYASLPTAKIALDVTGTNSKQWTALPKLSVTLADVPTAVKVQIKNTSASGKVRYDGLSLKQSTGVIPLPPAQ